MGTSPSYSYDEVPKQSARRPPKMKPDEESAPPQRSRLPAIRSAVVAQVAQRATEPMPPAATALSDVEIDRELATRVIKMWEERPEPPLPHVRVAAQAIFAWHNTTVHPLLVTDPKAGQLLHHVTAEILIRMDPDFFYSELGPNGRRAYVSGGVIPDNVEYQLAQRLLAWIGGDAR